MVQNNKETGTIKKVLKKVDKVLKKVDKVDKVLKKGTAGNRRKANTNTKAKGKADAKRFQMETSMEATAALPPTTTSAAASAAASVVAASSFSAEESNAASPGMPASVRLHIESYSELLPGVKGTPERLTAMLKHIDASDSTGILEDAKLFQGCRFAKKYSLPNTSEKCSFTNPFTKRLELTMYWANHLAGRWVETMERNYPWTPDGMLAAICDGKTAAADARLVVDCPDCAARDVHAKTASGLPKCMGCVMQALLERPPVTPLLELIPGTKASPKVLYTIMGQIKHADTAMLYVGGGSASNHKNGASLMKYAESPEEYGGYGTRMRIRLRVYAPFDHVKSLTVEPDIIVFEGLYAWTPDGLLEAIFDAQTTLTEESLRSPCPECALKVPHLGVRTASGMPKCMECMLRAVVGF
jgi:ribosomal protein L37AE/L43A